LADERLEGCQHFAFKEYKNAKGDCILCWQANGQKVGIMKRMLGAL
jgi:hypothetical protein